MKKLTFLIFVLLCLSIMLLNCVKDNPIEPVVETETGTANLTVILNKVGQLAKISEINLQSLCITLSSNDTIIYDTVSVTGNGQNTVNKTYNDLACLEWTLYAESYDVIDKIIHSGSTTFTVQPEETVNVTLDLTAQYSMLVANFINICDSVTRCEILVDGELVADSSFLKQSLIGSTVTLSYDYLKADTVHLIRFDVYGEMWGIDTLLYTGDTTITVVSGEDKSYTITLDWVGPDVPPSGKAEVQVTLGSCGTVGVNGVIDNTLTDTVTDIDGNVYQTVTIGTQLWMAENLKVIHYRNGDAIPNVTDATEWEILSTGAYCNYNNNSSNADTYGQLYNWYAVNDSRNIAPEGWHVPSDAEWKELEMYLGMSQSEADAEGLRGTDEGGKLKETGTTHWISPNTGATNESGFSALPGGYRNHDGYFSIVGSYAYFWSSTEYLSYFAWSRLLYYYYSVVNRISNDKECGFSVRCLRD